MPGAYHDYYAIGIWTTCHTNSVFAVVPKIIKSAQVTSGGSQCSIPEKVSFVVNNVYCEMVNDAVQILWCNCIIFDVH